MAKYSDEFKLKVVLAYLEGSLGYTSLAKAFNISTESLLKRWVRAYKEFGEAGLRRRSVKQVYS
ncbi:helix-turn-helix domain-containing protein, partial [Paenisporosarcina sp. TG-14]|uniref:helix-turn-helix domain-containing protein n=1 Tax=Paenisporosarcina sp. TG-14 TaxID=1231057 RepID=UPI00037E87AA